MGETKFSFSDTRDLTKKEWQEFERELLLKSSKRLQERVEKDIAEGRADIYSFKCKGGHFDAINGFVEDK